MHALTAPLAAVAILHAGLLSSAAQTENGPVVAPKTVLNLLADPDFKDFTWHLNPKQSLATSREEVWRIKDGQLHVTGKGFGYFRTKTRYRDYHLVLEYQWGEHTWGTRSDRARDCGLLLHAYGKDGAFAGTWMNAIEAQLIEGGSGDLLVLAYKDATGTKAPTKLFAETVPDRDGEPVWKAGGARRAFPPEEATNARINWRGRDPDWTDTKGYRGSQDLENPVGEWNRLEVICRGGAIQVLLNGEVVNEGSGASPDEGFLCLQSEGAECRIRRWELWPLDQFKEHWAVVEGSNDTGYSTSGESILPRRLPLTPEQSRAAWEIDGDGYDMQLAASEPLVCDPVDVVWDARGRMYVAEMRDYPLPPSEGPLLSRIRILFDKNGDGQVDESRTWADELDHCQGLCPLRDGLLVTTRTAVLFLRDSDGDMKADERTVLFQVNEPKHNQLQVSSPRWGLDNAIYLSNGLDGREIYPPGKEGEKTAFARANLRYDPRTGEITTVSGFGQFGGTQDDWGHRFACTNRNPVIFSAMPLDAVKRNPLAGFTDGHIDIQPQASQVWPIALSHTTSIAHAGTHTAACGIGVYRGSLNAGLTGDLFVCEPTAQLVTRNHLVPEGASYRAERVGNKRDFLVSADEWTRPVNTRNGPDGAFYICDMYRRFIDHAIFFPEAFSKSHYMRAGFDQGRLWRLAPAGNKARRIEPMPESADALVPLLEHPDSWRRIHAQRLLVEARSVAVGPALIRMLTGSQSPQGRVHAFWTLQGLGLLSPAQISMALKDSHPGVVENALALADPVRDRDALLQLIRTRTDRAAFLALLPLVTEPADDVTEACRHLLTRTTAINDLWMRRAILTGDFKRVGPLISAILQGRAGVEKNATIGYDAAIEEFATALGALNDAQQIAGVLDTVQGQGDALGAGRFLFARALGTGLARSAGKQKSLAALLAAPPLEIGTRVAVLQSILEEAGVVVADSSRSAEERVAALPLVAQQGLERVLPLVERLIAPTEPSAVQQAACQALARFDREKVAEFFFSRWKTLPPAARREALTLLSGNTKTARQLMLKMKAGEINAALMDPMQRWVFGRSKDEEIKALAIEVFGQATGDRGKVISDYQTAIAGKPGDPAKGRAVFEKAACITCHKLGDLGAEVGPSLVDVRAKPREALLSDILDPNRAVEERWTGYSVEMRDGRTLAGLIAGETADQIIIKLPGGISENVARSQLKKFETTGMSLMPVGLEAAISHDEMADLLAFLKQR
ncbi:MAG: PVC-type heme-binding CxxCH protein [Verrucomicrobiales bacterium]|nr:DUF1080 domain-containing protein [Verrucomicrobiae bacterium]MCP5553271.1 DUF1080 domain-containing protein [Akkermansiaceae bacterium]